MSKYPPDRIDTRWITAQRGEQEIVDPYVPYGYFNEPERMPSGQVEEVTTILLSNKECSYRCLMCDLWRHTTRETVPLGAIPAQIEYALARLPVTRHIKLYNSGSFFDRSAIPFADYGSISRLVSAYETVVVESHTAYIGSDLLYFNELIQSGLQVAIGLETIHPEVLPRLNKQMTLADFEQAVGFLRAEGIASRAFILLRPPFLSEREGIEWARRTLDFAFQTGVDCCVVIPVRAGNGAMERLRDKGYFEEPSVASLEEVLSYGIGSKAGIVFADLWNLEHFSACNACFPARKERLKQMNLSQEILPEVICSCRI